MNSTPENRLAGISRYAASEGVPIPHLGLVHLDDHFVWITAGNLQLAIPCIKRIRLEKEISQERLALLAEVDRSYVGRVERGDNNVAVLTLARVAKALDNSISELMQEARL